MGAKDEEFGRAVVAQNGRLEVQVLYVLFCIGCCIVTDCFVVLLSRRAVAISLYRVNCDAGVSVLFAFGSLRFSPYVREICSMGHQPS